MKRQTNNTSLSARFQHADKIAVTIWETGFEDEAVQARLQAELIPDMLLLEEYYFNTVCVQNGAARLAEDVFSNLYLDCILECIKKFRPDKAAKFTTFFKKILEFRILDKTGTHAPALSLDMALEDEDGETGADFYNRLEDPAHENRPGDSESQPELEALVSTLLLYIVELLERLCETGSDARVLYYKLFYTTRLVDLIKNEPSVQTAVCQSLKAHEREAVGEAEAGLLDFTYTQSVNSIDTLYWCPLRTYGSLPLPDPAAKAEKVLDLPFRNKVLTAYLTFAYRRDVSEAMLSKMKKKFDCDILAAKELF